MTPENPRGGAQEAPHHPLAPDPLWPIEPPRPFGAKRVVAALALFLFVVSLPMWVGGAVAALLVDLAVVVTLAQWWGLLAGFAGVPSLAAGLHAGVGTYLWVGLVQGGGVNPVVGLALAALGTAAVAMPSGWLLLRLAPSWGALSGLVMAAAVRELVSVIDSGADGRTVADVAQIGATLRRNLSTWLAVMIAAGSVVSVVVLRRSRLGLAVVAARDDPEAAATLGVRYLWERLALWCAAAGAIAAAGVLVHFRSASVSAEGAFDPLRWVVPGLVAALLGGMRTLSGPVLGAVIYVVVERIVGTPAALLVCSVAAALLLVVLPRGLADSVTPWLRSGRELAVTRVAAFRGRSGPSTAPADPR